MVSSAVKSIGTAIGIPWSRQKDNSASFCPSFVYFISFPPYLRKSRILVLSLSLLFSNDVSTRRDGWEITRGREQKGEKKEEYNEEKLGPCCNSQITWLACPSVHSLLYTCWTIYILRPYVSMVGEGTRLLASHLGLWLYLALCNRRRVKLGNFFSTTVLEYQATMLYRSNCRSPKIQLEDEIFRM